MKCGIVFGFFMVFIRISCSDQVEDNTSALNVINQPEISKREPQSTSSSTTMKNIIIQHNKSIEALNVQKVKRKKKVEANKSTNNKDITQTTEKSQAEVELRDNQDENKDRSNIEIIPKKSAKIDDEKTAIKRNPKDAEETESDNDDIETTHHKKPFLRKGFKKPKLPNTPDIVGETKPGKPTILPRKFFGNNPCATTTIKKQLDGVKERVARIIERMDQANFNCAALNAEIDLIKTSLQQIVNKIPEAPKHRETNRGKLLDNIRERQAKIHARFGKLEIIKPKSVLVGNREPVTPSRSDDAKMIDANSKIALEPTNL